VSLPKKYAEPSLYQASGQLRRDFQEATDAFPFPTIAILPFIEGDGTGPDIGAVAFVRTCSRGVETDLGQEEDRVAEVCGETSLRAQFNALAPLRHPSILSRVLRRPSSPLTTPVAADLGP